ncbi:formyltetrahydrofolate deformylase [Congregibacter brevis]|uniref:Formyltetrahydrofolate deformylase n=1 Tax=Congregibacter brevis TaxID=3081201 RepID=A0ABZ0I7I3_9GAMM|nr:formyltetrahydrofolate deformylase [Congregibacter sp. IMCC45268]
MSSSPLSYVLSFSCPDSIGVVARYSNLFYECGINITEISNYTDPQSNTFFLRCVFDISGMSCSLEQFEARLKPVADELEMKYRLRCATALPKIVIAVSKYDHCLTALLTKQRAGALPADIVAVVSNHENCRALTEWHNIPFHYLPITSETKPVQEAKMLAILDESEAELLVLARYMQILSDDLCAKLSGRAINIHHSFLPGFKGAKPYHQAYDRGVKVIGATAHYVTADLDEGPIIAQEVRPIDHEISVEQMVHLGHDTEATALSQAVRLHCEQRVILNGQRTVIL